MAIYDRYLTVLFFRVMLVLFSALCGLFMIVDFFDRLEEFIVIAETEGSMLSVAIEFYAPRVLSFFDRISGLVALIAAVFVVTWIQRSRELIAIYAGGIHLRRVMRPILICVILVAVFGIVNREVLIPSYKHRLTRDTRNWFGQDEVKIRPMYDRMTGVFLNGKAAVIADQKILSPIMQLPPGISSRFDRVVAESARYLPADENHPAGYLFLNVNLPDKVDEIENAIDRGEVLLYTPLENEWLEPGTCFLTSRISVTDLTKKESNAVYSSTMELVTDFRNPSRNYNSTSHVLVHARLLQPLLDISLLFIGLPLVVSNKNQNVFLAIGLNLVLVVFYFLTQLLSHTLGTEGFVSPALAAWIPIFIFVPLAYLGLRKLS